MSDSHKDPLLREMSKFGKKPIDEPKEVPSMSKPTGNAIAPISEGGEIVWREVFKIAPVRTLSKIIVALDSAERQATSCDALVTSLLDGFKCPCCGAERISHDPITQYDMKTSFNHDPYCPLKPLDPQEANHE